MSNIKWGHASFKGIQRAIHNHGSYAHNKEENRFEHRNTLDVAFLSVQ